MTVARGLIVHADDLGLTASVNAGILLTHRHGIVRSTSLMTTTPGFDDAVALARQTPTLDLGLHLNLTTGGPCLPPSHVASLVDERGYFHPLGRWLLLARRGRISGAEVLAELTAQVERGLASGLRFSHLDGHHHIHLFAPASAAVATLARRHGIGAVRLSDERRLQAACPTLPRPLTPRPLSGAWCRQWLLARASRRARAVLGEFARADYFTGLPMSGPGLDASQLATLIAALPVGRTELMCHPGYGDPTLASLDPSARSREREVGLLTDPTLAATLQRSGVTLLTLADLTAGASRSTLAESTAFQSGQP